MIRQADSLEDWQTYFRVYEDSLIRWGEDATSRYGWELFEAMFRRNSPHIQLWVAMYEGKLVAGDICFYAKRHVVAWHAAALEKFFHLRPVNLLRYEVIKNACEQGYSWYDLNPSGGHEGVKQFKKRLGAVSLPCHTMVKEKKSSELMRRMAQKLKNYSKLTTHRLNHRSNRNTEAADNLEPKTAFCDGQIQGHPSESTEEVKGALK